MRSAFLAILCATSAIAAGSPPKVKLPTTRNDLAAGGKLFQAQCGRCHGANGEGSRGPSLKRPKLARAPDDAALLKVIEDGIRGTEMPGAGAMTERERRQTAAYVRSLGKLPMTPVPGDPAHGAEIYRGKGNCSSCHSINGEGGVAGPDLSTIGAARSPSHLRESCLIRRRPFPRTF